LVSTLSNLSASAQGVAVEYDKTPKETGAKARCEVNL